MLDIFGHVHHLETDGGTPGPQPVRRALEAQVAAAAAAIDDGRAAATLERFVTASQQAATADLADLEP